jgi:uncharacterized protein YyaL (SSP411 family)
MPGFCQLLMAVAEAWQQRRGDLESAGDRVAAALREYAERQPVAANPLPPDLLERAAHGLLRTLDPAEGGFGRAPKFPQPMTLDFLLQMSRHGDDPAYLQAVTLTLTHMAHGGIYDHLGGGFHRYSTDAHWLVPHFEKMLYDNAQLARTYLHAWQVTGDAEYRRIAEETLDYVLREMTGPEGGFYSTQDADSEGVEGKFFLWTPDAVTALLGDDDARLFNAYYDVTPHGNFREGGAGQNILHVTQDEAAAAQAQGVAVESLREARARGRQKLFTARQQRVHPGQDQKILAEWNGLMLAALAQAGAALGRPDYLDAARRTGEFLRHKMWIDKPGGPPRLYRSYKDGQARLNGYLEDYAAVALGMLVLYEATLELHWLRAAADLAPSILALFSDSAGGGFYQTSAEHEQLVVRRKDFIDSATPSGNSLAAELFLRLGKLQDRPDYTDQARAIMSQMSAAMGEQPGAFGRLLCAADFDLHPGHEIAIAGPRDEGDTRALLAEVWHRFLPNSVLAFVTLDEEAEAAKLAPFLAGRTTMGGHAAAYVCQNYLCRLPVTDPAVLAGLLQTE